MRNSVCFLLMSLLMIFSSCKTVEQKSNNGNSSTTTDNRNAHGISTKSQDQITIESLIIEGQREELNGNYTIAETNYQQVFKTDAENATAHYRLANLYFTQHENDKAAEEIVLAVKVAPQNKWMWLLQAEVYDAMAQYQKSADSYKQVVGLDPDDMDNYFSEAFELTQAKSYNEAIEVYNQIEKRIGVDEQVSLEKQKLYDSLQQKNNAINELIKLQQAFPNEARYYALLADAYNNNNQHEQAMAIIQQLVKIDPTNPQAQLALYNYYRNNGNLTQAFISLKAAFQSSELNIDTKVGILVGFLPFIATDNSQRIQATELANILTQVNTTDAKAWAMQGDVFFQTAQLNSALDAYKQALQIDESRFGIWQQVISIFESQKQYDSMLVYSEKALQLFPEQLLAYVMNGNALLFNKNYTNAISSFNFATAIGSDDKILISDIYLALATCYHATNKNLLSDSCFRKALIYSPNNKTVLNNFSYYLALRNENLTEAKSMIEKAIQLENNNPVFEDTYAWLLFRMKNYSDAKVQIEKAIHDSKNVSAVMYDHYGDILFMNGDIANAVANWKLAKNAGLISDFIDKKISDQKLYE